VRDLQRAIRTPILREDDFIGESEAFQIAYQSPDRIFEDDFLVVDGNDDAHQWGRSVLFGIKRSGHFGAFFTKKRHGGASHQFIVLQCAAHQSVLRWRRIGEPPKGVKPGVVGFLAGSLPGTDDALMNISSSIRAYAPATLANLGPGFDVMGLAISAPGDVVEAWLDPAVRGVEMVEITGDGGLLPQEASQNTAGVAAMHVLEAIGWTGAGIRLRLEKGLPLGSGLGSSAASAAAAATAVNHLLGEPLSVNQLLEACRQAEAVACGTAHADNVAPALVGGIVLIPPDPPVRAVSLPVPTDLWCALVHPNISVRTEDARAVLPRVVPMADAIANTGRLALLVHALHTSCLEELSEATQCALVTPYRKQLIPGYDAFVEAARIAGAVASGIAGSGPTLFALTRGESAAERVAIALEKVLQQEGMTGEAWAAPIDARGARILADGESP